MVQMVQFFTRYLQADELLIYITLGVKRTSKSFHSRTVYCETRRRHWVGDTVHRSLRINIRPLTFEFRRYPSAPAENSSPYPAFIYNVLALSDHNDTACVMPRTYDNM